MSKTRHSTEQIIWKPREAEVELSKGQSVDQACKKLAATGSFPTHGVLLEYTLAVHW